MAATCDFYDERYLTLNLAIDTPTGASASGATALDRPQTFTSPSGHDIYTTPAGEIPLDHTFLDTRAAISASWSQPLGRLNRVGTGLSFSREYDYRHGGVATSGDSRRFLLKDGVRYSHILDPLTGWPVAQAPRAVTVVAQSCTQAGMMATLASLQGADAEAFLDAQGLRYWVQR